MGTAVYGSVGDVARQVGGALLAPHRNPRRIKLGGGGRGEGGGGHKSNVEGRQDLVKVDKKGGFWVGTYGRNRLMAPIGAC